MNANFLVLMYCSVHPCTTLDINHLFVIEVYSYIFLQNCLKEVLAEVDILLDLAQFRQMVPDTTATHMDTDALILYHSSAVIAVRDILGFAEPPRIVVRWTPPNFSRMTLQVQIKCTYVYT